MKSRKVFAGCAAVLLTVALSALALGCSPQVEQADTSTLTKEGAQVVANAEHQQQAVESNEAHKMADKHLSYGTECQDCHIGETNPLTAPVTDEGCRSCHDMEALVAATEDLVDRPNRMVNPHDSHIGDVDCMLCHANHDESEYYCLTCHPEPEYQDIVVP